MKLIIVPGTKFGRLTFIRELDERTRDGKIQCEWLCDCGQTCVIRKRGVTSGNTQSCGCISTKVIIEIGAKYGKLLVIKELKKRDNKHIMYKCECDCGNIVSVPGSAIRSGTKSCGCGRRGVYEPGTKYGHLTLICELPQRNGANQVMCEWLCDCGNICIVPGAGVKRGRNISCGCAMTEYHAMRTANKRTDEEIRLAKSECEKRRYYETAAFIDGYRQAPCSDCGGTFPVECMDFDHIDPTTKVVEISKLRTRGPSYKERIWAEIQKCELVCANCHRIRSKRQIKEKQRSKT